MLSSVPVQSEIACLSFNATAIQKTFTLERDLKSKLPDTLLIFNL